MGPELERLARELVQQRVAVIFAPNPLGALMARRATRSVPIVFAVVGDPVGNGLVASLARPGGNATGMSALGSELGGKRLELLKEIVPGLSRVAVIWNPSVPDKVLEWSQSEGPARALGIGLQSLEVGSSADFDGAFEAIRRDIAKAILVFGEPLTFANMSRIVAFGSAARLPTMFSWREAALEGSLIAYGPSITENYRRAAEYVAKILRGAKPADLPVEQPTKFELVVNLKTAKALGITIPQSILLRADEVIE
jgi:putative ABC transport system substrate-binding protein